MLSNTQEAKQPRSEGHFLFSFVLEGSLPSDSLVSKVVLKRKKDSYFAASKEKRRHVKKCSEISTQSIMRKSILSKLN